MKNKIITCVVLFVVLVINYCTNEHAVNPRDNPCDPYGTNYMVSAGNDTTIGLGDTIPLQGKILINVPIVKWEWKIGDNDWAETSGSDTSFLAPLTPQTFTCVFRATNKFLATAHDTVIVYVQTLGVKQASIDYLTQ